jgi:hypothetical protein
VTRGTAPALALRRVPDVRDHNRFDDRAADKHASTVRDVLDELDHAIHPSLGASPHFKSCWEKVAHVRSLLSTLRPIRKEDRDKLSTRLNEQRSALKHLQDEYWLERKTTSDRVREYVLNDLRSARLSAHSAQGVDGLREAEEKLEQTREKLMVRDRDSWGSQLLKEARDECWEAYRQVREAVHSSRVGLQDLTYGQLRGLVATVEADAGRDNPFEVFMRLKGLQRDVTQAFLSRHQREDLQCTLRSAWEKASVRADEHRQRSRERLDATQVLFEEIIERKRLTISKLEATIYDLRGKAIWNDEYGERVADWITERERRISEIEAEIRELQEKLISVRERLSRL